MNATSITFKILMLIALISCDQQEFKGSGNNQRTDAGDGTSENANPTTDPSTPTDGSPTNIVPGGANIVVDDAHQARTPACAKNGPLTIDASVAAHQDLFDDREHPRIDVSESAVVSLPLDSISGSTLPVSFFSLDDVVILVKEHVSIASVYQSTGGTRTITVPSDAFLLYNGALANYADGMLDSRGTTFYKFGATTVTLYARTSKTLREVYSLGAPLIAHNQIEIADLKNKGFKVGNDLRFKFLHVAHGIGFLAAIFSLPKCP